MNRPETGAPKRDKARVLRAVVAPFQAFFRLEAASGLVMVAAAALALAWANSPLRDYYDAIFHAPIQLKIAGRGIDWTVHHFTNDALMTLFFLVAGLEIKRELVEGELRSLSRAALPLFAAAGGMVVPAAIYLALNPSGEARAGWGVPMATDIAFALGCLSLVRRRVPTSVFVFLTALAIFDDLGAIVVIALFYGGAIEVEFLIAAVLLSSLLVLLGRLRVPSLWPYMALGALLWVATLEAGIHATIAGVVLGLALPTGPGRAVMQALHGVVAFGIVPLFALANAGVTLSGATALGSRVMWGAFLGLVAGKPIGVLGATWIATRLELAERPSGATFTQLFGASLMAGIGFTMSLLVGNLGLGETRGLEDQAKLGVLSASVASALLGLLVLRQSPPLPTADDEGGGAAVDEELPASSRPA